MNERTSRISGSTTTRTTSKNFSSESTFLPRSAHPPRSTAICLSRRPIRSHSSKLWENLHSRNSKYPRSIRALESRSPCQHSWPAKTSSLLAHCLSPSLKNLSLSVRPKHDLTRLRHKLRAALRFLEHAWDLRVPLDFQLRTNNRRPSRSTSRRPISEKALKGNRTR